MFQWKIWIEYYDDRKDCEHCEVHEAKDNNKESYLGRILNDEELQARFFEMKAAKLRGKNSSGGNQNSRDFGMSMCNPNDTPIRHECTLTEGWLF